MLIIGTQLWEKKFQIQPHVVYLSISSGVKVGVTRKDSVNNRWIDQGAIAGFILEETPNRNLADQIEVENIAQKVEYLINMTNKEKDDLQIRARKVVEKCDWKLIAKEHWHKVYNPLIN